ncbi:MAG: ComF family protein [Thermomicrobiales bacterium]|nr:ComF family protein [Thermomicrobiales bacterium]
MREAIISFKYENERARRTHLAAHLIPLLDGAPEGASLVPVPLHPSRLRGRGYNQAELLARAIGTTTGWPVEPALLKARATRPQVGLSAAERATNVRDAFETSRQVDVSGRRFLLIDDVLTTGATLSACADALAAAGARWVGALTIARDR